MPVSRRELQEINAIDEPMKARAFRVERDLGHARDIRRELLHGGNGVEILEQCGGRAMSHAAPHSVVGSSPGVMYRLVQSSPAVRGRIPARALAPSFRSR